MATTLADQIVAGQDLYSINCVECHGDDGKVTEITGVEGLEGKVISAINGRDVLYTLNDAAMAEVIAYGRPDAGMTPFGRAYNPEGLSKSEIDYLVTFMRYTWDDRFEAPPIKPLFPALADGEVPSYDVHIQPIVKRYCISCHREGKTNNNYLMTTLRGDPDDRRQQGQQHHRRRSGGLPAAGDSGHAHPGSRRSRHGDDPHHAAHQPAQAQRRRCLCALDHGRHAADRRGRGALGRRHLVRPTPTPTP